MSQNGTSFSFIEWSLGTPREATRELRERLRCNSDGGPEVWATNCATCLCPLVLPVLYPTCIAFIVGNLGSPDLRFGESAQTWLMKGNSTCLVINVLCSSIPSLLWTSTTPWDVSQKGCNSLQMVWSRPKIAGACISMLPLDFPKTLKCIIYHHWHPDTTPGSDCVAQASESLVLQLRLALGPTQSSQSFMSLVFVPYSQV